jgi:hypothetical protein
MKALTLSGLLACLLIWTQPSDAQEPAKSAQQPETQTPALAEKIHDVSPNKKFAMPGVNVGDDARGTWLTPLEIEVEGNVRREWLKPIRWVKPGVLLLEQSVIFRGEDAGEATYRLTTAFDEKAGKFRITSKKKIPSKE